MRPGALLLAASLAAVALPAGALVFAPRLQTGRKATSRLCGFSERSAWPLKTPLIKSIGKAVVDLIACNSKWDVTLRSGISAVSRL
jgi:hypothetical protein